MVAVASIRDKALILLLTSTGMRLGAVPPLQIKDLTEVDYDGYKLYRGSKRG
jgi:site-specific recombinase XerD